MSVATVHDYFDYLDNGITPFKSLVIDRLLPLMTGGRTLDLACGRAGLLWAMGYIERIEELDFADLNQQLLEDLENELKNVSPEYLEEHYGKILEYIVKNTGADYELLRHKLAIDLVSKAGGFMQIDFLKTNDLPRPYDTVLSIGGCGCVDSNEDLRKTVLNIKNWLTPGGRFLGTVTPYSYQDEYVLDLIKHRMEGRLNPDIGQLEKVFSETGFLIEVLESQQFSHQGPYNSSILFCLKKS